MEIKINNKEKNIFYKEIYDNKIKIETDYNLFSSIKGQEEFNIFEISKLKKFNSWIHIRNDRKNSPLLKIPKELSDFSNEEKKINYFLKENMIIFQINNSNKNISIK